MSRYRLLSAIFLPLFTLAFFGCGKESVTVRLEDRALTEVPAGKWLQRLGVEAAKDDNWHQKIDQVLKEKGDLIDNTYHTDDIGGAANKYATREYRYDGMRIEKIVTDNGVKLVYIPQDPIPYSELLPKHHEELASERSHEITGRVIAEKNGFERRLYLIGKGESCKRIKFEVMRTR